MPTPAKPISVIKQEGNKRRLSKAAIKHREQAEKKLTSKFSLQEWDIVKNDIIAHKEFLRIKKILKNIEKDDALHESSINRYCILHSECMKITDTLNFLEIGSDEWNVLDAKLMQKRKMMLDIEKENIMTIASALRSIPKKPPEEKHVDPMEALLRGG
jgi:hypothetical protein